VWRSDVQSQNVIVFICRDCHTALEREITRKENIILQQHPEIYTVTLQDFVRGYYNGKRKTLKRAD